MTRSRTLRRFVVCTLAATGLTIAGGPGAHAAPPSPRPDAAQAARATASALVERSPAAVRGGPDDAFTQLAPVSSHGWQYVPYTRTYRGLAVVGGDFVLAVAPSGQVASASVAQRQTITGLSVTPRVSKAAAERTARAQFSAVSGQTSTLVVYALSQAPRLAWESVVRGTRAGLPSELTVDVDAVTGKVLRREENLKFDNGTGHWNGPEPLPVPSSHFSFVDFTQLIHTKWILADPPKSLQCDVVDVYRIDPPGTPAWDNGDPQNSETACVDALFDAETENAMLSQWLGRNGFDGGGHGWPIWTDGPQGNAFYDPNSTSVHIGVDQAARFLTQMDVVAHEMGHGIDGHTPGGASRNGTEEFVADAFGTASEWFANEPAPYAVPDYVAGNQTSIERRVFYDPSLSRGHSTGCYSDSIVNLDPHDAAGVGDNWFYLVAEGANPTDGQPAAATCSGGGPSTGLGIQRAIQILYNAMLMKTSASSYPAYRTWTLTATANLFPGDCATYNKVRQAWDAVEVPQQPGDPKVCALAPTVLTGDFNKDGHTDLALTGAPLTGIAVPMAFGHGGSFTHTYVNASDFAGKAFPSLAALPGVTSVTGDFDKDGSTDIALIGLNGRTDIPVAFSHGDGTFDMENKEAGSFQEWARVPGVRPVSGDFDQDGRTDIALLPGPNIPWWHTIPVAFSNGDGTFRVTNTVSFDFANGWAQVPGGRAITGDFDRDGRTDIALLPGPNTPWWYTIPVAFSNGDGTFRITNQPYSDFANGWAQAPGVRVVPGDFDHDGRTDIALVPGPNTPWWYTIPVAFSNGDGTFRVTNTVSFDFANSWAQSPGATAVAGDFDGDGRTDIALTGVNGWNSVPVAMSNGDGTFRTTPALADNFPEWAASEISTVIDVRGMGASTAAAYLWSVGLYNVATPVTDCEHIGMVVSQSPAPGSLVFIRSNVAINVGQPPPGRTCF